MEMSHKLLLKAALLVPSDVLSGTEDVFAPTLYPALPAELVTGHQLIDFEHKLLLNSIATLRRVCSDFSTRESCEGCLPHRRHDCETTLVGLLGDLLVFIMDHFRSEEQLMRDSLLMMVSRDLCEAHMEDHAAISGKVQQIIAALSSKNTFLHLRELDVLLHDWVTNHMELHDLWLTRWVEREDSMLRATALLKP